MTIQKTSTMSKKARGTVLRLDKLDVFLPFNYKKPTQPGQNLEQFGRDAILTNPRDDIHDEKWGPTDEEDSHYDT